MGKSITEYLTEILDNVTNLKNRHNNYFSSDLLIAYRGEPKDYKGTKLMPSLFRDSSFVKKEKYL